MIYGYQILYTFEFSHEGKTVQIPQIFIEKWFTDPSFHITSASGILFYEKNGSRTLALATKNIHQTNNPQYLKINLNIAKLEAGKKSGIISVVQPIESRKNKEIEKDLPNPKRRLSIEAKAS